MIITTVPTLFIFKNNLLRELEGFVQSMEIITNKEVNIHLDEEKGTLCLTGILVGTMVFLYDSQGELMGKYRFTLPSLTFTIPKCGTYVLVMSHPNCQPEVRRITYS